MSEQKASYKFATQGIMVGKFSAVVVDTSVYDNGFALPGGQNVGQILGIVQEGVVPFGASDYNDGVYSGISQAAWPANLAPTSGQGMTRTVIVSGRSQANAAGAINRGDWLIIADNLGRVASIGTLAIPPGTKVFVVGRADQAAVNPNDVIDIWVNIHDRHT
jgi:hypothetical protein